MNVKEKMEKRYVEFIPIVVENETFLEESSVLIEDIKELQTRLDTQVLYTPLLNLLNFPYILYSK